MRYRYFSTLNNFLKTKLKTVKLTTDKTKIKIIGKTKGSKGTRLNNQFKLVKPKTNIQVKQIPKANLKIEKGNLVFSPFLVLQSLNNRIRPHIPVLITHKLEKSLSRIMPFLFNIDNIKILIATQSPEGNAFEITCLKKFPLTLSLFGSKAKINDGIPIVTTLIRLN